MKNKIYLLFLSGFVVLSSCTTDSLSDLGQPTDLNEITYNSTIKSIIDSNCIVCHGNVPTNGAPMSLTTYENVKDAVLTRNLLDRISRTEGTSGAMPFDGPRLPQNDINTISEWIDADFPQ